MDQTQAVSTTGARIAFGHGCVPLRPVRKMRGCLAQDNRPGDGKGKGKGKSKGKGKDGADAKARERVLQPKPCLSCSS